MVASPMRLKRVNIFGFKTFADKTDVHLDGGLVAVVGPNGCGKSNLVDAILWGLGEGSAKQLRAQSGQDVIFNGSAQRKPVGFAEVALTFDNEDGGLPVDTNEVEIRRRINRAGDSEYFINRQSCRLRDILELLADSGLGRAGYAIVGQKEIDAALSASAEDRRAWIDEAAGVQRYRARKIESLRRLSQAEDHLSRVQDILTELEGQREPLREEAEVARRYKAAQEALQGLEIDLLAVEIAKAIETAKRAESTVAQQQTLIEKEEARAEEDRRELEAVEARLAEYRRSRERLTHEANDADRQKAHQLAEARSCEERIAGLRQLEGSLSEEEDVSARLLEETQKDVEEAMAEAASEEQRLEEFTQSVEGSARQLQERVTRLRELERELEQGRIARQRALREEAEAASREERARLLERERGETQEALPELREAVAGAEADLAKLEGASSEIRERQKALLATAREREQQIEAQAAEIRRKLAEGASLEGRIRGVESTLDSLEGMTQGPRAVLEAVQAGRLPDRYVSVSHAISTEPRLAVAIETALGAAQNDLIVPGDDEAKEAIRYLKENRAGRCTFQPISLMRPLRLTDDLLRASREKGILGRASELVRFEEAHRPVVESLLGRILVAENLDVALRLARTTGWNRIVTLDGEVVQSSGAVTGGTTGRIPHGAISRAAELEALRQSLQSLQKAVAGLEAKQRAEAAEREQLIEQASSLDAQLGEGRTELEDQRRFVSSLQAELRDAERSIGRIDHELAQLAAAPVGKTEVPDLDRLETERDVELREIAATRGDVEGAEDKLRELRERARAARARVDAAMRRLRSTEEQVRGRAAKKASIGPEIERLQESERRHRTAAEELAGKVERWNQEVAEVQRQEAANEQLQAALTIRVRDASANRLALQGTLHQAEVERARAETVRTASAERLLEEYGIEESEAVKRAETAEVPKDAHAVVARLRREMRAMGDVNLGAIEAYDRLTVRLDELSAQKEDVEQGMREVLASIRELDKLTRGKFSTTFEAVRQAFGATFQRLFGGGSGELRLSDPDNLLESGIEVEVTLPGKKRQPLALLSGGERSLCAAAFLFALLQVKPSPLVVLDEVDAPLDGRNVERFADLLVEFSETIQFIVITHNAVTTERAPVWLGVTMQDGVTTVVPARL